MAEELLSGEFYASLGPWPWVLGGAVLALGVVAVAVAVAVARRGSADDRWGAYATEHGLRRDPHDRTRDCLASFSGTMAGREVALRMMAEPGGAAFRRTAVCVQLAVSVPTDLVVTDGELPRALGGQRDFRTGHPGFDRRFHLEGRPVDLAAVLTREARSALLAEDPGPPGPAVRGGDLVLWANAPLRTPRALDALVGRAASLASLLDGFERPSARLLDGVLHDPRRRCRQVCGELLLRHYRRAPEALVAAGHLDTQDDPELAELGRRLRGEVG